MSGIVLSASVRQNLLALQNTASMLATTQNNLAHGTKDNSTPVAITGSTLLSGTSSSTSNDLASGITTGDTLTVNGVVFTFVAGSVSAGTKIGIGDSVSSLLTAIDAVTGASTTPSTVAGGKITLATGTAQDLTLSGSALAQLGLTAATPARAAPALSGQTL